MSNYDSKTLKTIFWIRIGAFICYRDWDLIRTWSWQIANIFASWVRIRFITSPVEQRNRDKAGEVKDELFPRELPQWTFPPTNDPLLWKAITLVRIVTLTWVHASKVSWELQHDSAGSVGEFLKLSNNSNYERCNFPGRLGQWLKVLSVSLNTDTTCPELCPEFQYWLDTALKKCWINFHSFS